jgi:hypothetical protein
MEKKIKVHIFCLKAEICSLIKKMFNMTRYEISCSPALKVSDDFLKKFHANMDCIILDMDIDKETKDMIKQNFGRIPVICLPSLDFEGIKDNDVKYISEPLRLSELRKTLDEIFQNSQIE